MKILALSPHTDDAELGAGASVARWLREGHKIVVAAFSTGSAEPAEFRKAMETLKVDCWTLLPDFETRLFPARRQKILDALIRLRDKFSPDLILVPSTASIHQDHQVMTAETQRAFQRGCSILGYYSSYSVIGVRKYFSEVSTDDLRIKIRAICCYTSQAARTYMNPTRLFYLAALRGAQAGVEYAEEFEVIRWLDKLSSGR